MITNDIIGSSTADDGARPARPCGNMRVIPEMPAATHLRAFPRTIMYLLSSRWIATAMPAPRVSRGRGGPGNIADRPDLFFFRCSL